MTPDSGALTPTACKGPPGHRRFLRVAPCAGYYRHQRRWGHRVSHSHYFRAGTVWDGSAGGTVLVHGLTAGLLDPVDWTLAGGVRGLRLGGRNGGICMELKSGGSRKPDRAGALIAAVAGPSVLLLAHLAVPYVSLRVLLLPSIAVAALLTVALRRRRRGE
ncbi:hypothetical protein GCM10010448_61510 [Streptomyces glomeratus]|uniref:Uncharacterized protein n=2 Tax=Streptomyces glomeratus TaxID=284452 RepID=A0ABP6M4B9_9ACTN